MSVDDGRFDGSNDMLMFFVVMQLENKFSYFTGTGPVFAEVLVPGFRGLRSAQIDGITRLGLWG